MDNGLVIEDLVVGEGQEAKDYNKVVVNYTGTVSYTHLRAHET